MTVTSESLFSHIPLRKPPRRGTKNNPWLFPGRRGRVEAAPQTWPLFLLPAGAAKEKRGGRGPPLPLPLFRREIWAWGMQTPSRLSGQKFTQEKTAEPCEETGLSSLCPGSVGDHDGAYVVESLRCLSYRGRRAGYQPRVRKKEGCLFGETHHLLGKGFQENDEKKAKLFFFPFAPWQNENQIRKKAFELQAKKNRMESSPLFCKN